MIKVFVSLLTFVLTAILLLGCSGSSNNKGNDGSKIMPKNRIHWESISSDFNPSIVDTSFKTAGLEQINIDIFNFTDDVEVVYSDELHQDEGGLRLYKVWKKSASWGYINNQFKGKALNLDGYGSYACSIHVVNGKITNLEGGCYVRVQIFLPKGKEIEVYNVGQLITKRFFPEDVQTFLARLDHASFDNEKLKEIEIFLNSYKETEKTPVFLAKELGLAIHTVLGSDLKFKVLEQLHVYVKDRDNLKKIIEDEFDFFAQEKAKKIVGI